jgi:hypothetical protein
MRELLWFLIGLGLGSSFTGLVLTTRYGRALNGFEARLKQLREEIDG